MTVKEILNQIEFKDGKVTSLATGKIYEVKDFVEQISDKCKLNKRQRAELESHFVDYLRPQSDKSTYVENIINKYNFAFSDGIYFINGEIMALDDIYRFMWANERLLPTETDDVVENVEKISEQKDLQFDIYHNIISKSKKGKSLYLESLYKIYPNIKWHNILYNILLPKTKPLFHIFYDDGVGGTGKSTLLEVLTKIVGEKFVSNVLLDQFGNRFIFANMLGKYLNIGDDNGRNDELQNVGTLKSIITGNRVTIDRKNISPIEVRIFAKQLFATNILPYIDFTDGGIMRRLNIVPMNKIIPSNMKMCELDDDEIGHIIYEIIFEKVGSHDLQKNNNELAITTSPLYLFYTNSKDKTYIDYSNFCDKYGFRKMNVINFEVKSKFIKAFLERKKDKILLQPVIEQEKLPF